MNILFLHRNFPAQFRHLFGYLRQDKNNKVVFITNNQKVKLPDVLCYKLRREVNPEIHPYLHNYEEAILHGQGAARAALKLKDDGFVPDIIIGHAWGPLCFIKDVFPNAPLIGYFEWFYHSQGSDVGFGKKDTVSIDKKAQVRIKNSHLLTELYSCDRGIVPTKWQYQQIPSEFYNKLSIIHDGIDTQFFKPNNNAKDKEIVTYTARGLEEYRGFPQFMEAVAILLKKRPNCHFVIAGDDFVHYGTKLPDGQNFRELMVKKFAIDLSRVHFTGFLPYADYLKILQASWAHVYLTYPFVLSWSMLEAMFTECLLIASKTPPVLEVVEDNKNGFLVDFFSPQELADRIEDVLKNRKKMGAIRKAARKTIIENYSNSNFGSSINSIGS